MQVLEEYKSKFGQDFADNKKALDKIAVIRSKGLKNEIAGYITKSIKHEIRDIQIRKDQEQQAMDENTTISDDTLPAENTDDTTNPDTVSSTENNDVSDNDTLGTEQITQDTTD